MERAVVLAQGRRVEADVLPDRVASPSGEQPRVGGEFTLEAIEQEHIEAVVRRAATLEDATHTLGIDPSTLWRKRKRYQGEEG